MSAFRRIELILPCRFALAEFGRELELALKLRPIGHHSLALTYYDGFDWRLHRAGFEFGVEEIGGTLIGICGGTDGGHRESAPVVALPRFARELPDGRWHNRLAKILDERALLARAELHGERREFALEDGKGAALHLVLEEFAVDRVGTPIPLPARLYLASAKGSRKEFRHVLERLSLEFGLEPAEGTLLSAALAVLGLIPEDPSALPRARLDPELRADAAIKPVLRNLLETLRINEAGIRAETDTEFLHDFRVALRRTRSALGQLKKVFPDRVTQRFAHRFAELGRITGEARDLDVYLLDFDRRGADLPEFLRDHLEPLRHLLGRRAVDSHARLSRYLESAAWRRLAQSWSTFLDTPPPHRPRAPNAKVPIGELAGRRIWKLYRRVLEEGGAIAPDSPPERIHELRKTAKKLRYLMELFQSLYLPEKIGPLVKILKGLQEHLGEYQDAHVQIAQLRQFSAELRQADAPTETLLALGALLDRLYAREKALRDGFGDRFAEFAEDGHQRKFRHVFKPVEPAAGAEG